MEFDSEVLVNQAPTLKLANGKTATFMTQYDTKTLLLQYLLKISVKKLQLLKRVQLKVCITCQYLW